MANLKEEDKWEDGIYQIEENDPVLGGEKGITNKPAKQLANRTLWLKKALELLTVKSKPKDLTADSASEADKDGHSHAIAQASTTQAGIVRLLTAITSTSETHAATPKAVKMVKDQLDSVRRNQENYIPNSKKSNAVDSASSDTVATSVAVKTAYDKGVEALNKANQVDAATLKKNGNQSINGVLKAENVENAWAAYKFGAKQGEWQLEVHPDSHTTGNRRFNMLWVPSGGNRIYLSFPHIGDNGEMVAYQSWVNAELQKVRSIANQNSQNFNNYIHNSKKSNAVDSNSTDTVASSRAVKLAFDRGTTALNTANSANTNATNANNNANGRVSKSGDTITGQLRVKHPNIGSGSWSNYQLETRQGYWRWEVHPDSHNANDRRLNMVYADASGDNQKYLWFPTIGDNGETVAYQNWVSEQIGNAKSLLEGIISNKVNRSDFIRTWYPKHYKGAEVFKIRPLGLMITTMSLGTVNSGVYKLPESYTGFKIASAIDAGGTRLVTADVTRNNEVTIRMSGTGIAVDLIIIGYKGDI